MVQDSAKFTHLSSVEMSAAMMSDMSYLTKKGEILG